MKNLFSLLFFSSVWLLNAQTTAALVDYYPPGPVPDRIITSWKTDPSTSFAVNWRTAITVTKGVGQIAVASASPDFDSIMVTEASSEMLVSDLSAAYYHSLNFTGLKSNTTYVYRVGDGQNTWSEWIHFRTAEAKEAPFSFIYFGDAQNDIKSKWSRTIRQAYSDLPKADFMIHAGDLINVAQRDHEWGEWFYAGGWIYQNIPSVPTPGNHEYARVNNKTVLSKHWRPSFTLPENGPTGLEESVYYIDYQGTRVISLNTTAYLSFDQDSISQMLWLDKVLQNNPNKWTVVTMHHPVYSPAGDRDNPSLRNGLKTLFDKYNVDVVLQGHDHTYARGGNNLPIGATVIDSTGPVYAVSVSGPKMYLSNLLPWIDRAAVETQLYQLVQVNRDTLTYETYTTLGELYDKFKLIKTGNGRKKFIDLAPPGLKERIDLTTARLEKLNAAERGKWIERFNAYKARKLVHEEAIKALTTKGKMVKAKKKK
jgi:Purple acid Phosphatase, N-terminal domain/Calcineurin-like phosphoesterase